LSAVATPSLLVKKFILKVNVDGKHLQLKSVYVKLQSATIQTRSGPLSCVLVLPDGGWHIDVRWLYPFRIFLFLSFGSR
jgi:hypothetical protein